MLVMLTKISRLPIFIFFSHTCILLLPLFTWPLHFETGLLKYKSSFFEQQMSLQINNYPKTVIIHPLFISIVIFSCFKQFKWFYQFFLPPAASGPLHPPPASSVKHEIVLGVFKNNLNEWSLLLSLPLLPLWPPWGSVNTLQWLRQSRERHQQPASCSVEEAQALHRSVRSGLSFTWRPGDAYYRNDP